jgi:hypothetical protein
MRTCPKAYGAIARSGLFKALFSERKRYFQRVCMHCKKNKTFLIAGAIVKSLKRRYTGAIRDLACLAVSPCAFKGPFPRTRKIRIEDRANDSRGRKNS